MFCEPSLCNEVVRLVSYSSQSHNLADLGREVLKSKYPRSFWVLRDRPQVLYIFGKLVDRAIRLGGNN